MSVGLVLPPGSRTRANNLVVPFQEMDLTAHPYSVQEGTEEFYALFRRRYGEPKPEFYPFTDVSGSHASDFDAILRHIAQYDPTFFATMGLGNTGDGTGVPTEEEIHDAQYARGVGVVLFARADMVGPRPEPPAPPVPPIPPVIPPVEPPVPPGGPTIPEPPLPPFFFNDKAETAFTVGGVVGFAMGLGSCITGMSRERGGFILLGIILIIIGFGIGALISSRVLPKDIKKVETKSEFPRVKELIKEGWSVGEKPPGVQ